MLFYLSAIGWNFEQVKRVPSSCCSMKYVVFTTTAKENELLPHIILTFYSMPETVYGKERRGSLLL
jgi:hypothetical protein